MTPYTGARLRHAGIRTRDIAGTTDFYSKVFGLIPLEVDSTGESAVVGDGTVNLTIVPIVVGPNVIGPVVEGSEAIHLGFVVPDLLDTFRRCQEWGATILAGDIASREPLPPGALPEKSFKVADPNGNVIDVVVDPKHWSGVTL